jgi:hypothetical protein
LLALTSRSMVRELRQIKGTIDYNDHNDTLCYCIIEAICVHFYNPWNLLDLVTIILNTIVITLIITHNNARRDATDASRNITMHLSAANTWLLWCRAIGRLRGFDKTARYVGMFLAVTEDMMSFLVMIGTLLVANAYTMMLQYPTASSLVWFVRDSKGVRELASTFTYALFSSFKMMLGDFDTELLRDAMSPTLAYAQYLLFMCVVNIVMLNLLIALMGAHIHFLE